MTRFGIGLNLSVDSTEETFGKFFGANSAHFLEAHTNRVQTTRSGATSTVIANRKEHEKDYDCDHNTHQNYYHRNNVNHGDIGLLHDKSRTEQKVQPRVSEGSIPYMIQNSTVKEREEQRANRSRLRGPTAAHLGPKIVEEKLHPAETVCERVFHIVIGLEGHPS